MLGKFRSRFEIFVHRMVHTRNSVALESEEFAGGWELEGHLQTALGQHKEKGAKARQCLWVTWWLAHACGHTRATRADGVEGSCK